MTSIPRRVPLRLSALLGPGLALLAVGRPAPAASREPVAAPVLAAQGEEKGDGKKSDEKKNDQKEKSGALTKEEALAAFDQAWKTVHDTHFDPKFNGVDWDALKVELRPRAERATTREELREVIGDMLGRLSQSHFAVIPADVLPTDAGGAHDQSGGLGFDVRLRGNELLVVSLEPGLSAAEAGVRVGWSVTRIGSFDALETRERLQRAAEALGERRIAFQMWAAAREAILGVPGGKAQVRFRDESEQPHELELERRARHVTAHDVGTTLPTFYLEFEERTLERGGKELGYVRFSNWFLPVVKPFDQAIDAMRGRDGIVIDLRGNTGGAAVMTMGVAGHFFSEAKTLGVMTTRDSTVNIRAFPRIVNPAGKAVKPYAGPLAILVDETTGSASEVFAGGMQSLGRARVFGETTAGAVLPAMTTRLPDGDALLHAMGDFETATGQRLEGVGVVPDAPVVLTRADLLAGRDAQLEAACEWILAQH